MIKIVSYRWMRFVSIISFSKSTFAAQAFFGLPIMIVREKKMLDDEIMVNHETIHFFQAMYLLFIGFWIIYVGHWLINLVKYRDSKKAYMNIIFEKEAYSNQSDLKYLLKRKPYGWINYR